MDASAVSGNNHDRKIDDCYLDVHTGAGSRVLMRNMEAKGKAVAVQWERKRTIMIAFVSSWLEVTSALCRNRASANNLQVNRGRCGAGRGLVRDGCRTVLVR